MAALRRSQPDWSLRLVVAGDGPLTTRATALGVPVKSKNIADYIDGSLIEELRSEGFLDAITKRYQVY